jgi:arylsulfatase A-like enzyme
MLHRRDFLRTALAAPALPPAGAAGPSRTNFVLILIDDLGWTDFACYGSRLYETPNIDRLASEGMRFTQAYSACTVCSPSRAAVMTGKYPARLHITDYIPGHRFPYKRLRPPEWIQYLPLEEVTLAEALKEAGYATASIGKWHLGGSQFFPEKQGFDVNIGGCQLGAPPSYFSPYRIPAMKDGPEGEYLIDRLSWDAAGFVERNRDRPFFLYFPNYGVHAPRQAKPELIAKYQRKVRPGMKQTNAAYAAMIDSLDQGVGKLVDALKRAGVYDRTVFIVTSDNGGSFASTSNHPLRSQKGSAYEGGVRVPLIVRWPGITKPGSMCATPVIGVDFFPTLLEIAGVKRRGKVDGESIVPLLRGKGGLRRDAIYWHYPHYHAGSASPHSAIRSGDFRLVEFQEDGRCELYNVESDIGESRDLAIQMPDKAGELRARLHKWREEVDAQMALPNPGYDPARQDVKAPSPPPAA